MTKSSNHLQDKLRPTFKVILLVKLLFRYFSLLKLMAQMLIVKKIQITYFEISFIYLL